MELEKVFGAPLGGSKWDPEFLAAAWPNPSCCRHLRREALGVRSPSLPFKELKIKFQKVVQSKCYLYLCLFIKDFLWEVQLKWEREKQKEKVFYLVHRAGRVSWKGSLGLTPWDAGSTGSSFFVKQRQSFCFFFFLLHGSYCFLNL